MTHAGHLNNLPIEERDDTVNEMTLEKVQRSYLLVEITTFIRGEETKNSCHINSSLLRWRYISVAAENVESRLGNLFRYPPACPHLFGMFLNLVWEQQQCRAPRGFFADVADAGATQRYGEPCRRAGRAVEIPNLHQACIEMRRCEAGRGYDVDTRDTYSQWLW